MHTTHTHTTQACSDSPCRLWRHYQNWY